VTKDGVDDVLVANVSLNSLEGVVCVQLVDGASAETLYVFYGESDNHIFGYSLATIGDVDGDGCGDWLIGAPAGSTHTRRGRAEIWSGADHQRLAVLEGSVPAFGVAVAGLGDIDGDGTPDFAIASPPVLLNTAAQGSVTTYSGRTRTVLHTLHSEVAGTWFGANIANVGDTNGDGIADLAIGGNFGGAPGLVSLHDGATGAELHTWRDSSTTSGFGKTIAAAGDVDGDGAGDVLVAAVRLGSEAGLDEVFLFSGATGQRLLRLFGDKPGTGFGTTLAMYRGRFQTPLLAVGKPYGGTGATGVLEFWRVDGTGLATTLIGPMTLGRFGGALSTTNDTDGDGRPELFVSCPKPNGQGKLARVESASIRWFR
jgi:hypothetical protein